LVKDVAGVFESVAVGPLHTPALYSCFLRALVSARLDSAAPAPVTSATATSESEPQQDTTPAAPKEHEAPSPELNAPQSNGQSNSAPPAPDPFAGFFSNSEMGPVADISTFPPTMVPNPPQLDMNVLSMDNILSADFWDNVLVPGSSNTLETLSNGFVYGAGGSGLITPRMWMSPLPSIANTPSRNGDSRGGEYMQDKTEDNSYNMPRPGMPSHAHSS